MASRTANGIVSARKPSSAAPPTCISQNAAGDAIVVREVEQAGEREPLPQHEQRADAERRRQSGREAIEAARRAQLGHQQRRKQQREGERLEHAQAVLRGVVAGRPVEAVEAQSAGGIEAAHQRDDLGREERGEQQHRHDRESRAMLRVARREAAQRERCIAARRSSRAPAGRSPRTSASRSRSRARSRARARAALAARAGIATSRMRPRRRTGPWPRTATADARSRSRARRRCKRERR